MRRVSSLCCTRCGITFCVDHEQYLKIKEDPICASCAAGVTGPRVHEEESGLGWTDVANAGVRVLDTVHKIFKKKDEDKKRRE